MVCLSRTRLLDFQGEQRHLKEEESTSTSIESELQKLPNKVFVSGVVHGSSIRSDKLCHWKEDCTSTSIELELQKLPNKVFVSGMELQKLPNKVFVSDTELQKLPTVFEGF